MLIDLAFWMGNEPVTSLRRDEEELERSRFG